MALKANLCSVMHAQMLPGKSLGFNRSASLIFSNLSFRNNAPTSLPCLSLRKEKQQYSNYNHNVIRMSGLRATKLNAAVIPLEAAEVRSEVPVEVEKLYTTVVSVETLVGPKGGLGEVCHIVLDHGGSFKFKEGQYLLVHFQSIKRYFSIASCSRGDTFDDKTLSLCVRRAELLPDSVSNYLCNVKAGDTVEISGPFGGQMVFTERREMNSKHIMVASATGVAPFRSNIQHIFSSILLGNTDHVWLISGADNYNSLLYDKEFTQIQNNHINRFRYQRALNNSVEDSIYESGNEIFTLLKAGAYIYIAGSSTMLPGIKETFVKIAQERGVDWPKMLDQLQKTNHWRVEVY
ncbi:ferredoxin--NADP reductase, root isozyme, chloroplastic-like isoform X2 [Dioscorea cayenensis subsp. rotundata]|uniref:ferredoxin--NADP(+) reductase n=1 Tax=Dioscorea cayennensis subsp. rotundata TaxID=55577 RepID=A0AB40CDH4_DIOCR|nr:ferredoxin--NADP reductase, root isozyme, chloroplastic-like isoform X2 [Dioscorea cayenensis subsp. rotundata]